MHEGPGDGGEYRGLRRARRLALGVIRRGQDAMRVGARSGGGQGRVGHDVDAAA